MALLKRRLCEFVLVLFFLLVTSALGHALLGG